MNKGYYGIIVTLSMAVASVCEAGLDAGIARYEGKELSLSGGVEVHHSWGKVKADAVQLMPQKGWRALAEGAVCLRGSVSIALTQGGILTGDVAELDGSSGRGRITGKPVRYVGEDGNSLASSEVILFWEKENGSVALTELLCLGDVELSLPSGIRAYGDRARYSKEEAKACLEPKAAGSSCYCTGEGGLMVEADRFLFDLENEQLMAEKPHGECRGEGEQPIAFKSEYAVWRRDEGLLFLQGGTTLWSSNQRFKADGEVQMALSKGELGVKSAKTEGMTELVYGRYSIACQGRVLLDREKEHMAMWADVGNQVICRDGATALYGDRLECCYRDSSSGYQLSSASLVGHACLVNGGSGGPSGGWQYVFAERIEYLPKEDNWVISSQPPQRVLLSDELNGVKVNAPNLFLHRDSGGEVALHSVGDVRFSFAEVELNALRQRFPRGSHAE